MNPLKQRVRDDSCDFVDRIIVVAKATIHEFTRNHPKAGITSVVLVTLLSQARILLAMARYLGKEIREHGVSPAGSPVVDD